LKVRDVPLTEAVRDADGLFTYDTLGNIIETENYDYPQSQYESR
jgi:YD repeat-containing protein